MKENNAEHLNELPKLEVLTSTVVGDVTYSPETGVYYIEPTMRTRGLVGARDMARGHVEPGTDFASVIEAAERNNRGLSSRVDTLIANADDFESLTVVVTAARKFVGRLNKEYSGEEISELISGIRSGVAEIKDLPTFEGLQCKVRELLVREELARLKD